MGGTMEQQIGRRCMTFGNILSGVLGLWFIPLGASKGSSLNWGGYMGAAPPSMRP
jgi:hypothetical protein